MTEPNSLSEMTHKINEYQAYLTQYFQDRPIPEFAGYLASCLLDYPTTAAAWEEFIRPLLDHRLDETAMQYARFADRIDAYFAARGEETPDFAYDLALAQLHQYQFDVDSAWVAAEEMFNAIPDASKLNALEEILKKDLEG